MIETGSYNEFSIGVHEDTLPLRVPTNGTIEITNRCPLECVHCYNNLPMADRDARHRELSTDELKRVLDELAELGCLWLLFTGGEIFARADFMDIYRHAKSKGFLITLFTNGTLITERIVDQLAAMPPFSIEITLYGRTKATYEALTGIPGSFENCMRGIRLLLERKLPLKLKTVAITVNKHEVKAMKRFAEELGVEFKFDPMINPRIDCSASPLAVRLTPAEMVAMDLDDPNRLAEWHKLAGLGPIPWNEDETPLLYECGGGLNSFAIDPYGDMTICVLSHVDKYNVRDGSVREGWNDFLHKVRQKRVKRITKCTHCHLTSLCGSCAATNELENGEAEAPVDFLCQVAHLRAEVLDIDVRAHGDCEYCKGGSRREHIEAMAADVRSNHQDLANSIAIAVAGAAQSAQSGCGTGGCGSCSLH